MKNLKRNLIILLSPFLILIIINELTRSNLKKSAHKYSTIQTINSAEKLTSKCTWVCHQSTQFCKENHVKISEEYTQIIDPIYFGIIQSLKSTGEYGLANLIVFVVLFPLLMFYFLIRILDLQKEIQKLKAAKK